MLTSVAWESYLHKTWNYSAQWKYLSWVHRTTFPLGLRDGLVMPQVIPG